MNQLHKPKNRWGWLRAAGVAVLAGILAWTVLSALLRASGEFPWLAWSGYQSFSLLDGLELAVLPLLAVFLGGWLEEHDHRVATEHSNHQEAERAVAARRAAALQPVRQTVLEALGEQEHGASAFPLNISVPVIARIHETIRQALPALDGKGKGDLLIFLFEHGLVSGEKPAIALDGVDFRELALSNAHLNGVCLDGMDLRKARLDGAQLAHSRCARANLRKAFLRHANLQAADLAGCDLTGAHLEHANLEGADLRNANLEGTFLRDANLKDCVQSTPDSLDQAILIETILPDGRKVTNAKGKEYLRNKEIAVLVDRL